MDALCDIYKSFLSTRYPIDYNNDNSYCYTDLIWNR